MKFCTGQSGLQCKCCGQNLLGICLSQAPRMRSGAFGTPAMHILAAVQKLSTVLLAVCSFSSCASDTQGCKPIGHGSVTEGACDLDTPMRCMQTQPNTLQGKQFKQGFPQSVSKNNQDRSMLRCGVTHHNVFLSRARRYFFQLRHALDERQERLLVLRRLELHTGSQGCVRFRACMTSSWLPLAVRY